MPFAKTKAWPVTEGTFSSGACAAAGFGLGAEPMSWVWSAANVKAAVPSTHARAITTAGGNSVPNRMFNPSEPNGGVVIPLPGEEDDRAGGRRLAGDDREHRMGRRDSVARSRVLP